MDIATGSVAEDAGALLDAVRARDAAAFTRLVAAHDVDLLRLAYVISGSRDQAEDAAEATWVRLWQAPPHLRDATKLRAWLLTVCANEARGATRRRRRGAELEVAAAGETIDRRPLSDDLLDLQVAIGRLETRDRELLGLRFAVELPSSQIGEHLGISSEGARTRLHRVLQRLRKELSHD